MKSFILLFLTALASISVTEILATENTAGILMVSGPLARHHRRRIHRSHYNHQMMSPWGMAASRPKALLEVMKIRERIVVDEQNRPKAAEVTISEDLMQIDPLTGNGRLLRHGEIKIKPKNMGGSPGIIPPTQDAKPSEETAATDAQRTFITEFGVDGMPRRAPQIGSRLDRFIRYLHLNEFWPLFTFSVVLGFSFVGLIFLTAKLVLSFIDEAESEGRGAVGYHAIPSSDDLLESIESAQPIKNNADQMTETKESAALAFAQD